MAAKGSLRETSYAQSGFDRADVCPAVLAGVRPGADGCWRFGGGPGGCRSGGPTSAPRPVKPKRFVDDEVLCELFEKLADAPEPAKVNFRFVLGLILMRKRLLAYEASRDGDAAGHDVWVVRRRGQADRLDLLNPHLDEQPGGRRQPAGWATSSTRRCDHPPGRLHVRLAADLPAAAAGKRAVLQDRLRCPHRPGRLLPRARRSPPPPVAYTGPTESVDAVVAAGERQRRPRAVGVVADLEYNGVGWSTRKTPQADDVSGDGDAAVPPAGVAAADRDQGRGRRGVRLSGATATSSGARSARGRRHDRLPGGATWPTSASRAAGAVPIRPDLVVEVLGVGSAADRTCWRAADAGHAVRQRARRVRVRLQRPPARPVGDGPEAGLPTTAPRPCRERVALCTTTTAGCCCGRSCPDHRPARRPRGPAAAAGRPPLRAVVPRHRVDHVAFTLGDRPGP